MGVDWEEDERGRRGTRVGKGDRRREFKKRESERTKKRYENADEATVDTTVSLKGPYVAE
jgi:hypothetical protein